MKYFQVWCEGYASTGQYGRAEYIGCVHATDFKDACIKLCSNYSNFNPNTLSIWGCKLFDNEIDARRSFG